MKKPIETEKENPQVLDISRPNDVRDEKKMVEGGTLVIAYSYTAVCIADDIALCASRAELHTKTGHSNRIACHGYGHFRGTNRPALSFELAGTRCVGGATRRQCPPCTTP